MPRKASKQRTRATKTKPYVPILPQPKAEENKTNFLEMLVQIALKRIPMEERIAIEKKVAVGRVTLEGIIALAHTVNFEKIFAQSIAPLGFGTALSHAIWTAVHARPLDFIAPIPLDTPKGVVTEPSGHEPTPGRLEGTRNDNSTTSIPRPGFPAWNGFMDFGDDSIDLDPVSDITVAFNPSSIRPSGRKMIAVDLGPDAPTEAFCAIRDDTAKYSCMTAKGAVHLASRHPNVVIRQTTPAQRQGQGFPTPAGIIVYPQRYVELALKAFEPAIPPTPVNMLIWEGDGPDPDVEVYLGWQLFEKLEARKPGLKAGDARAQTTNFGNVDQRIEQNRDVGTSSDIPAVFQSDMSPEGANNQSRPAIASSEKDHFPSTDTLRLFLSAALCESSFDGSEFEFPPSLRTSVFSDTPCSATTVSSLDPIIAPVDTMDDGLMKGLVRDAFAGYNQAASVPREDDPPYETIDPALLFVNRAGLFDAEH